MKAIGFTPGQVSWTLLVQILVPVALGAVIGVAIGSVLSQPVIADTARSFGLPTAFSLSAPVIGTVLVAALATAVVAAIGPAVRAGRLSAVRAITRGTTPSNSGPTAAGSGGRPSTCRWRHPSGSASRPAWPIRCARR